VSDHDLQDMLEGDLGKAILKRFDDKVEKCRELAVALYYGMVQVTMLQCLRPSMASDAQRTAGLSERNPEGAAICDVSAGGEAAARTWPGAPSDARRAPIGPAPA
jgi:hypothetical protein